MSTNSRRFPEVLNLEKFKMLYNNYVWNVQSLETDYFNTWKVNIRKQNESMCKIQYAQINYKYRTETSIKWIY